MFLSVCGSSSDGTIIFSPVFLSTSVASSYFRGMLFLKLGQDLFFFSSQSLANTQTTRRLRDRRLSVQEKHGLIVDFQLTN